MTSEHLSRRDFLGMTAALPFAAAALGTAASKVPVIIAVSCNVTTFARDIRLLIDGGYKLDTVVSVDQFRHTPHVELVAKLVR